MSPKLKVDAEGATSILRRHAAFWQHRNASEPLRYTGIYSQSSPVSLPQPDGSTLTDKREIEPRMVSPDQLITRIEQYGEEDLDAALALKGEYLVNVGQGDFLPLAMPLMKFPWLEAILGCPIEITAGQIWDREYPGDPEEVARDTSSFDNNPWFELYLEFLKKLQDRLFHRFYVSTSSNQRGVSDLAAAVMGVSEAAMGWLDDPPFMRRLLRRCTDAVLALVEAANSVIKPNDGGYACKWGLWSPEKIVATQADHASFVSPEVYRDIILPFDREVLQSSPMSIIHLHNNGLHHAPALLELPELNAIQVWVDPYPVGDRKIYEVEMLNRIATEKPLVVDVYQSSPEEADWLLDQLPQSNLFFKLWLEKEVYDILPEDYPGTQLWLRG